MKKTTTILATILFVIITAQVAFSSSIINDERMELRLKNGIVQLLYKKASVEKVAIKIKDNNGVVVYRENVSNKIGFLKNYDFRKLDEGFYTFEISDEEGELRKEIAFYKRASIALIKQKNDNYRVIYGTKKETKVSVELVNASGRVVFTDNFVSENGFSKVYNVSKKNTNAVSMRIITSHDTKVFKLK